MQHLIYQPFLNGREQLRKVELKEAKLLVQLEYIKQAVQRASSKKVSSDQE